jgi:LysR family transcriptional regulator (chromosome initiation inhibitor)
MVADLQRPTGPELVELERDATVDVALHLQRWRLRSPSLDRLAEAIVHGARERLTQ